MNTLSWHRFLLVICFAIGSHLAWADKISERADPVERELGSDHFVAGCPISVTHPVAGDLMAAGCDVEVLAEVSGDVFVMGEDLHLAAPVKQSVYVAGGHIAVDSEIQRNARIAGGRVELSPKAKIVGNVTIGAGEVEVDGAIGGYLQVGGGNVRINGPVAGDVEVGAGDVELGPNARIQGKLSYTSDNEIVRDAAAQVIGGVEHIERSDHWPAWHHWHRGAKGGHGWIWSLWLLVMAAILVAALPRFYQDVAETARTRWPLSMLIGFAVLVCVPVAAVIAAITLIGIPLALLMIVLYVALLLVGYVSAGIALGEIVLQRWGAGRATSMGWRITAAVVSMLAISLLHRMPFVGGVVVLAALVTGMGALLIRVRSASSRPSAPAASA